MAERIIVMHPGRKIAFAAKLRYPGHVVYAREERGKIVFRTKGDPFGRIAGEGMRERLAEPVKDGMRDTYALELLDEGDSIKLTTPAMNLRTCVNLDAVRDRIDLVGGASLVARIEGVGLEDVLDED